VKSIRQINLLIKTGQKLTFLLTLLSLAFIPTESLGQECGYVYVTPGGATSGAAGTKTNPASISYGLTLTSTTDNIVRVSAGTYVLSSEFVMIGDITIEGGFDATTWVKSNATPSIFHRNTSNIQSNPARLVAFSCVGINNFRILDITITMDDAVGNGISTYGIYLDGCSNFTLSRCIINLGNASDGFLGATQTEQTTLRLFFCLFSDERASRNLGRALNIS